MAAAEPPPGAWLGEAAATGFRPDTVVLDRTPLHAAALRIPHPTGRGWLWLESPLPDDMARCLDLLRAARRSGDVGPLP